LFLARIVDNVVEREFGSVLASGTDELPLAIADACVAVCGTGFPQEWLSADMLAFAELGCGSVFTVGLGVIDFHAGDGA